MIKFIIELLRKIFGAKTSLPETTPVPTKPTGAVDLASRIVSSMDQKKYKYSTDPNHINIVYVEGMDLDGTKNEDLPNKWNDLRLVFSFSSDGRPIIRGRWAATTEPGRKYTVSPINPKGAARIEFGQYSAWQVGMHRGNHEALVQTGGPVTVCRDLNKDFIRTNDKKDTGYFGINQHWGYDLADVDGASAGCLVGQKKLGHVEFMTIVKTDARYQKDKKFIYSTAILNSEDVL